MIPIDIHNVEPALEEIVAHNQNIDKPELRTALKKFATTLDAHLKARAILNEIFAKANKAILH